MVAVCIKQEISSWIWLGKKLFGSGWQLHDWVHCWMFVRILPMASGKMVNKKTDPWNIFSNKKKFCLRLSLWLPPSSKSTCLGAREDVQISFHDSPWCSRKHWNSVRKPENHLNRESGSRYPRRCSRPDFMRPNFVDPWIEGSKLCTLVDRKVRK